MFGASDDATTAWLDFFVQGDEEEGIVPPQLTLTTATFAAAAAAEEDATGLGCSRRVCPCR